MTSSLPQLQMVLPRDTAAVFEQDPLPTGYTFRTRTEEDNPSFFRIMDRAGWSGWDNAKLAPWLPRIPQGCWWMILDEATQTLAATAMGLHNSTPRHVSGGELGWVACDPEHRGKRLGRIASSAVVKSLVDAGYEHIHLYTEDERLSAIYVYFELGFVPYFYILGMEDRWETLCAQLGLDYTPKHWAQRAWGEPVWS